MNIETADESTLIIHLIHTTGFRHFPASTQNRSSKLAFGIPSLYLVSDSHCGSVVPDCLGITFRFPFVLCSRVSFRLSVRTAVSCAVSQGSSFLFYFSLCPFRAHSVAMFMVGMYRNDILVLFLQQPMTQFLRYLHSLFGCYFIRGERLNYVLCFGGASPTSETLSDRSELFCCSDGFCLAHKRLDKRMTSGLIPVHDVFKASAH